MRAIPKAVACRWVLRAKLPCLASVGEEVPSLTDLKCQRWGGDVQRGPNPRSEEGEGLWGRIVGGDNWEEGNEQDVKSISNKKNN